MELDKLTDKQVLNFLDSIKAAVSNDPNSKGASNEEIMKSVMDVIFYGFEQGDLRRIDLARIAKLLGYKISEEFMHDPHPDPYDLKHKKNK